MACRILICDDNDDDVKILIHTFNIVGLSVECARSRDGDEALAFLTSGAVFDLVILDHHLPRRSGLEVIEILRGRGQFPTCPIVVLTSQVDKGQEALGALGVHEIIEKPFTLEGYLSVVETIARLCG